jgi:hypothetical protein
MTQRPWMKFYPRDWRGDAKLRACGLAARGLWMEMLAIMHEATPYGHLLMSGKPVTVQQLANMAGCGKAECSRALAELEGASVFSRTDDGTIFSRRMVRDHAKAEQGKAHVAKRWGNDTEPTRDPNRSPKPNPITPEARKPESLASFFDRVAATAGIDLAKSQAHAGPLSQWLAAGCDFERDVLPTIAGIAGRPNYTPPQGLQYFTSAVLEAKDKRVVAAAEAAKPRLSITEQQRRDNELLEAARARKLRVAS